MTLLVGSTRLVNFGDGGVWGARVLDTGEQNEEMPVTTILMNPEDFRYFGIMCSHTPG